MGFGTFLTFLNPTAGANAQRGMPAPGAGRQTTGKVKPPQPVNPGPDYAPVRPFAGVRTWFKPANLPSAQRGMPAPLGAAERRNPPFAQSAPFGGVIQVHTRDYSRGAAGFVPNFGTVFSNPIGAGIPVPSRMQASFGPGGQYIDHQIFWASQTIPTSLNLNGLSSPAELAALLGTVNVQAVVRTT